MGRQHKLALHLIFLAATGPAETKGDGTWASQAGAGTLVPYPAAKGPLPCPLPASVSLPLPFKSQEDIFCPLQRSLQRPPHLTGGQTKVTQTVDSGWSLCLSSSHDSRGKDKW